MKLFLQTHVWALGGQMMLGEGGENSYHQGETEKERESANPYVIQNIHIFALWLSSREVTLFTVDRTLLAFIGVNISHYRQHLHVTETQVHPLKITSSEPCRHAVT